MWIHTEQPTPIRGEKYSLLLNLETGNRIYIDVKKRQADTDLNLHVWFTANQTETLIFTGTQVECMRVIDKFAEKLNAAKIDAWEA